jgi:chromosomal replication initiator protein
LIDGVLQLDLPQNSPDQAWSGRAAPFVVGPENALLVAPIQRLLTGNDLAEAARLFNPLVLVGPSGSGKSQLAQAITRHWRQSLDPPQSPPRRGVLKHSVPPHESTVEYFTAADFGRELQAASAEERLPQWQARIRNLRVLVIEDVHRLRPRGTIQQDLRHTIDAILESGGLIVITAQREPIALPQLDPSLRDRFTAGLTVRLQRPGRAAREAILRSAASTRGVLIEDALLAHLSRREAATPAELVGRLQNSSGPLSLRERAGVRAEADTSAAHEQPTTERAQPDQLKHIIAVTARYFAVTQAALTGPSRRTSLVKARNIIVHLARQLTDLSYAEIGRQLGGRDHTTIMHADRRLAEQREHDPAIQQALDELDRLVR